MPRETLPPLTSQDALDQIAHQMEKIARNKSHEKHWPLYRMSLGAVILGTLGLAVWDPINITNESEGDSELVAVIDRRSVVVAESQKYIYTHYEKDQFSAVNNPEATRITLLNRQMEYLPKGVFELVATEDKDLGFFILMQENDGNRGIPFDYKNILFSAPKPEPCDIESENNQILIDEYCTPLEDPMSRGVEYSNAWQGHPGFSDSNISARARAIHDIGSTNPWCELSMIYGSIGIGGPIIELPKDDPSMDVDFALNNKGITNRTIYLGVRRAIVAAFRRDAALQTGLPITNKIGMPNFLMKEEAEFLRRVAQREGKPLTQMTPLEYRTAVAFGKMNLFEELVPGEIDPGPTLGLQRTDYAKIDGNFDAPKNSSGEEITEYNALTYNEDYFCLPWTSLEGIQQSQRVWWMKEKLGELDGLEPYAALKISDSSATEAGTTSGQNDMTDWPVQIYDLDPVEAERVIQQFRRNLGLQTEALASTGARTTTDSNSLQTGGD